jgi:hypothetical protein
MEYKNAPQRQAKCALAQRSLRAGRYNTSSSAPGLVRVSCPCHASTNILESLRRRRVSSMITSTSSCPQIQSSSKMTSGQPRPPKDLQATEMCSTAARDGGTAEGRGCVYHGKYVSSIHKPIKEGFLNRVRPTSGEVECVKKNNDA